MEGGGCSEENFFVVVDVDVFCVTTVGVIVVVAVDVAVAVAFCLFFLATVLLIVNHSTVPGEHKQENWCRS